MTPAATKKLIERTIVSRGILTTGTIFYVGSTSASKSDTSGAGRDYTAPFATLAYAITQVTASVGDVIVLMPGHAETINSAAVIALSVAGITVVGVGDGSARPTFTWATDTAATLTITAASVRITNCVFNMALPSALVSGIVISAASCQIDNCRFHIGTAGTGTRPLQAILTTAGADYLKVLDCQFLEPSATPTTISAASAAITLVGGTGIQIRGNTFCGWYTTTVGAIACISTLTNNLEISFNNIFNRTASSAKGISLLTASTGFVVNNRIQILVGTAPIGGDGVMWAGNYYAATIATAGTLV